MTQARARILVAEDEPLASMALRAQLEALGHEVTAAARDGDEAVALGRCLPIDVAVLDMRMPGRTGLDAAVELFRHTLVPAVLLTGFSSADLPDPVPQPPVFATLTKPIGLDELGAGVDRARERFSRWAQENDAAERRRDSLRERDIIARALQNPDDTRLPKDAARDLLDRARRLGTPVVDLARQLLHERG